MAIGKKIMSKGFKSVEKTIGSVAGIGVIMLIITSAFAAVALKKRSGHSELYKETFMDCGAGFCEMPPPA